MLVFWQLPFYQYVKSGPLPSPKLAPFYINSPPKLFAGAGTQEGLSSYYQHFLCPGHMNRRLASSILIPTREEDDDDTLGFACCYCWQNGNGQSSETPGPEKTLVLGLKFNLLLSTFYPLNFSYQPFILWTFVRDWRNVLLSTFYPLNFCGSLMKVGMFVAHWILESISVFVLFEFSLTNQHLNKSK